VMPMQPRQLLLAIPTCSLRDVVAGIVWFTNEANRMMSVGRPIGAPPETVNDGVVPVEHLSTFGFAP
jgi:hypothetical protein